MVGNTVIYIYCWLPFIDIFFFKTCVFVVVIFVFQTFFQPLPLTFSLTPKLPLVKSESQPPLHPFPPVTSKSTASEPPLDFSSPAEFTPSLDTSAARHRVSIKPRNQRASTKKRAQTVSERICLISYVSKQKRKVSIF